MLKQIVKRLAITLGAGLMLRAGVSGRAGARSADKPPADLGPLLRRLDAVELRVSSVESAVPAAGHSEEMGSGEIATLRGQVEDLDRRSSEQMAAVSQRLDDLQSHLPRFIDVKVSARIREMEERLKADIVETRGKTLETLIASVESKMLEGIAGVENSLVAQSQEIADLRTRLGQTDHNLSRILSTVERLADTGAFQFPRFEAVANGHS